MSGCYAGETERTQVEIRPRHSLAIRWLHWINFPLLTILLWSGLLIYWANGVHEIRVFGIVIHFFPEGFFEALNVPFRLATGLQYHLTFSWLFTLNGLLYVIYLAASGSWRDIVPRPGSFREAFNESTVLPRSARRRIANLDRSGYNPAQRIAYTAVVLMGLLAVLSGIAIAKSARFSLLTAAFGGYRTAKLVHFILALSFVAFFAVHVLQVIRAGWNTFRSMIVGSEKVTRVVAVEGVIEVDPTVGIESGQ